MRVSPIDGFPFYFISDAGDVLSRMGKRERVLSPSCAEYKHVMLRRGGGSFMFRVHRLVAMHFVPREPGKDTVNHKNGDKYDNRYENLEWCSPAENMKHAREAGRFQTGPRAKLTLGQAAETRYLYYTSRYTQKELACMFMVTTSTISRILSGKSYRAA